MNLDAAATACVSCCCSRAGEAWYRSRCSHQKTLSGRHVMVSVGLSNKHSVKGKAEEA